MPKKNVSRPENPAEPAASPPEGNAVYWAVLWVVVLAAAAMLGYIAFELFG